VFEILLKRNANISNEACHLASNGLDVFLVNWQVFQKKPDRTLFSMDKIPNIMKRTKLHPSTFVLFSALIVVFCFAGRSIGSLPGRSGDHKASGTDSVSDDIGIIEMQYKEAFMTGDSALFLKCYTPDACVLAPNTPTLCGQRGLSRFYKGTRQAGIRDASFNSLGLFGQTPEYVTQQGAIEVFDANEHSLGKGKVLIIWKKTDEGWRIFRHMLNFDTAMPPAPASSTK
jgi:ketosteroid isomerase-like protein